MSTDSDQKHPTPNAPKHLRVSGFVEHHEPTKFVFRRNLDDGQQITVTAAAITLFNADINGQSVYFLEALLPHTPALVQALAGQKNVFVEAPKSAMPDMSQAGSATAIQYSFSWPPGKGPRGIAVDGFEQGESLRVDPVS